MNHSIIFFITAFLTTANITWAQDVSHRAFKTHAVCYRKDMHGPHLDFIASHFDIVIVDRVKLARELRLRNPELILLQYKIAQSMHKYYPDWKEVDPHEDWFCHAQGFDPVKENRLMSQSFDEYIMDPRSEGWQDHYAEYIRKELKREPVFSGIFADNCWAAFPTPNQQTWYRIVQCEKQTTQGTDGDVIELDYPLSTRRHGPNPIQVRKTADNRGENYYNEADGCSWKENRIILNKNRLPGPPGTEVHVSYAAVCFPPDVVVEGWQDGITAILAQSKNAIAEKLLVGNSGNHLYGKRYLDVSDGVFVESFIHAPWYPGNWSGVTETQWVEEIESLIEAQKKDKWHLCHSGTKPDTSTQEQIEWLRIFCYASFLMGVGPKASFHFATDEQSGRPDYYPEWDLPLGEPKGPYTVTKIGNSNIYQREFSNGKAIVNPSDLPNAVTVDLGGEYADEKGNHMTKIELRPKHGAILVRVKPYY